MSSCHHLTSTETALLVVLIVWALFWKGLALWHAARKKQPWWYVIMIVVNTAGLLEIIYLFGVRKIKPGKLFSSKI
ncbi:DUF5652 family protein [Candidatus Saccharibacteria bacterium]|nr:DUF5652 family protein [Candidatus Saccharibacteria bacterium]